MTSKVEETPKESVESGNPDINKSDNVEESVEKSHYIQQENLLTKVLNVAGRSYYLDVRENQRGKYLKLTEASQQRRRTILLSGDLVGQLSQVLSDIIGNDFEVTNAEEPGENWTTIFSKRGRARNKKIYFDLMHNKNGRSLNIAEVPLQPGGRQKTAVIISEQGWLQLKRALEEISQEFPSFKPAQRQPRLESTLLETRKVQLTNKRYFLDLLENDLGVFLKLTEAKKTGRSTVFIPTVGLEVIAQLLANLEKDDLTSVIDGLEDNESEDNEREGQKTLLRKTFTLEANENSADSRIFNLDYKENQYGKFLRIVEISQDRPKFVFLPFEGFQEVRVILEEYIGRE